MPRPRRLVHQVPALPALLARTVPAVAAALALLAAPSARAASSGLASNVTCNPGWYVGTSNGKVQHPEVHIAFWQDASSTGYQWETWSRFANNPSLSQLIGATHSIVNSAYFSKLAQYGTLGAGSISRARISPYAPLWSGTPNGSSDTTGNFTFGSNGDDIQLVVESLIAAGSLPAPLGNDDTIYVVYLPTSATTTACGNVNGCNEGCTINGQAAECIYVKGNYTNTFTHETAEAISAWEGIGVHGCTYNPAITGITPNQIGDLCSITETQNTFSVASYWSVQDNACVIPESFGELYENDDKGAGWFAPAGGFPTRQMYGGGGGVVATSAVENGTLGNSVYFYQAGHGSWYGRCGFFGGYPYPHCLDWFAEPIGSGGSEFAAGGEGTNAIVAGITLDTKYGVNTYPAGKGLGQSWSALGAPNGQPVTSVQVTSNGTVVVTDQNANPYYWNGSGWVQLGGPGDQFVAWGPYILGLNPTHNDVFMINPGSGGWSQQTYNAKTAGLVAGADALSGWNGGWGMYQPGSESFTGYGIGTVMTGSGSDFAFTDDGAYLLQQIPYSDVISQCTINGSCGNTNGVGGRLVSGNEMYVTGCSTGVMPCSNL